MWAGFNDELLRQFDSVRELVDLRHQAPTREWPLVFVKDELLVIREWPNGSVTAYTTSEYSDRLKRG